MAMPLWRGEPTHRTAMELWAAAAIQTQSDVGLYP